MRQSAKTWNGLLFLGSCLLVGCASGDASDPHSEGVHDQDSLRRFVGDVEDSDAQVAVVTDGARARVYFCGGDETLEQSTHWFNIDLTDFNDEVVMTDKDFRLAARFSPTEVTGEVTYDSDGPRAFATALVGASNPLAGLYEGVDDCGRLGLILKQLGAGKILSGQGACIASGQPPKQVNPITPLAVQDGKVEVHAPGKDSTLQLKLASLTPQP
jgi:hypothetical protein